jgi:NADPH:quinone reductase-like Zn-dependent oxidoreductase
MSGELGEGLDKAGADEVVVGLDGIDAPVDVVLDNVGGPQLVAAWQLLAPGGSLQSIGWRGSVERFADAAEALRGRRVNGKAILDVIR